MIFVQTDSGMGQPTRVVAIAAISGCPAGRVRRSRPARRRDDIAKKVGVATRRERYIAAVQQAQGARARPSAAALPPLLEFGTAWNAPKRSDSITSSRVGEARR